ncbi:MULTISPECIES: ricin-type beta-trefoil lectin domain protein [unclassified Streptomyces]|uniref:ricin-type beta-trefoil lectin domain protein n=1 Tax=unclassified Streptomyces TaxID=2593676 RepID=UPI003811A8B7
MPSPSEPRHPEVLEGAPERFSEQFARRPALPRRGLLPGKRVWAATATAAAVVGCAVLVVPLLAQIDLFPDHGTDGSTSVAVGLPAASVSAGTPEDTASNPSAPSGSHSAGSNTGPQNSGPRGQVNGTAGGSGTVFTGGGSTGTVSGGGSTGGAGGTATGGGGTGGGGTTGGGSTGGSGTSGSGSSGSATGSGTGGGTKSNSGSGGSPAKPTATPTKTQQSVSAPGVRIRSSATGRCIDITNAADGIGRDGSRLRIWDCGGSASQKWDFRSDGSVHSLGLCMDLAWASTDNGTAVQLAKCNGGWAQQFVLNSAGDLVNPHADKCVDVVDKGTANGTKLQLWTCYGTSNQKWYRG